jgi:hypothetical protein
MQSRVRSFERYEFLKPGWGAILLFHTTKISDGYTPEHEGLASFKIGTSIAHSETASVQRPLPAKEWCSLHLKSSYTVLIYSTDNPAEAGIAITAGRRRLKGEAHGARVALPSPAIRSTKRARPRWHLAVTWKTEPRSPFGHK